MIVSKLPNDRTAGNLPFPVAHTGPRTLKSYTTHLFPYLFFLEIERDTKQYRIHTWLVNTYEPWDIWREYLGEQNWSSVHYSCVVLQFI